MIREGGDDRHLVHTPTPSQENEQRDTRPKLLKWYLFCIQNYPQNAIFPTWNVFNVAARNGEGHFWCGLRSGLLFKSSQLPLLCKGHARSHLMHGSERAICNPHVTSFIPLISMTTSEGARKGIDKWVRPSNCAVRCSLKASSFVCSEQK